MNRPDGVSFEEAEEMTGEQEFELLESEGGGRGSTEYPVRVSRFGNVRELTLRFVSRFLVLTPRICALIVTLSQSNTRSTTQSRLFYLGFLGSARALKKEVRLLCLVSRRHSEEY